MYQWHDESGTSTAHLDQSSDHWGTCTQRTDEIKNEIGSGVVAVVSAEAKKASLVVGITKDLEGKYNAIDLVRLGVTALGGKGGGGRWDMAQAGGSDYENGELALKKIKKAISQW